MNCVLATEIVHVSCSYLKLAIVIRLKNIKCDCLICHGEKNHEAMQYVAY